VAINADMISGQDETGRVILECDVVVVVPPVVQIFRELKNKTVSTPFTDRTDYWRWLRTTHSPLQSMLTSFTTGFSFELMWYVWSSGKMILPPWPQFLNAVSMVGTSSVLLFFPA